MAIIRTETNRIYMRGEFADATIFTSNVERSALDQIQLMLDHEVSDGCQVKIMPDVHGGKGCVVGTTIRLPANFEDWKVCPNIVGIDIGCGVQVYKLSDKDVDLVRLDSVINNNIPSGFSTREFPYDTTYTNILIEGLSFALSEKQQSTLHASLGTLGGGNHFIELGRDVHGDLWLSVHSGSRGLGNWVATHHQKIAEDTLLNKANPIPDLIAKLKSEGREREINVAIKAINYRKPTKDDLDLAYLTGDILKDYLKDMSVAQDFAVLSRKAMLDTIVKHMEFTVVENFDSMHNFVEHEGFMNGMIRKGATSAKLGERLIIPLNMRDGSLICKGLGNYNWNCSAPHGAGRTMSRTQAKATLDMEEFRAQMEGIYTTSVVEDTLDEAPGAYKPADDIMAAVAGNVEIANIVHPIYNYKAH